MASAFSRSDPIEFLVSQRFPFATAAKYPPSLSDSCGFENRQQYLSQVQAYERELRNKEPAELQVLYEEAKHRVELLKKAKQQEQERFFNTPAALADVSHWSKAAHWTLDEAIALSFGRAPELVNWEKVKPYVQVSTFALEYQRRRDLALRAKAWEQLFDPVLPGFFLAWAKRTDLKIPPELESAVTARGCQIADWKTLYDELEKEIAAERERWTASLQASNNELANVVNALVAQRDAAERAIVKGQADARKAPKELQTKERESLLRLVIGMAVEGYRYDPTQKRSDKTSEIVEDLEKAGFSLDSDTVRKWLRTAAEVLPPETSNLGL